MFYTQPLCIIHNNFTQRQGVPAAPLFRPVHAPSAPLPESPRSPDADLDSNPESDADLDGDWEHVCAPLAPGPSTTIRDATPEEPSPPTLSEVMLTVLDWYASHKQTYNATSDVYRILKLVVPPGTTVGTFKQLRAIMDRHKMATTSVFDACPKGCVVYTDLPAFPDRMYADLAECPQCGSQRFVGMGAHRRAAHCVYFFPLAKFLRDMHSRPDLTEHLDHRPVSTTPYSSVKRSRAYRDKILNNPAMNTDKRNQGIILSTDGIPYFGAASKHSRGAWPVLARLASLPDGLWDRFEYAHLYALEAQEHWYTDVETGKVHRKRRYTRLHHTVYNTQPLCITRNQLCIIHNSLCITRNQLCIIHNSLCITHNQLCIVHNSLCITPNQLSIILVLEPNMSIVVYKFGTVHNQLCFIHNHLCIIHSHCVLHATNCV